MSSNPPAGAQKATQVRWTGAALTGKAFFTVTVDNPTAGIITKDYINIATLVLRDITTNYETINTNKTYHHWDKQSGIELLKVDDKGNPLSGAGFTIYACSNHDPQHVHTNGSCSREIGRASCRERV